MTSSGLGDVEHVDVDVDVDVGSRSRPSYVVRHVDFSIDVKFREVLSLFCRCFVVVVVVLCVFSYLRTVAAEFDDAV